MHRFRFAPIAMTLGLLAGLLATTALAPSVGATGHRYFADTTGTTWGNRIGVLVSDRPDAGWRTTTGEEWGSTAPRF